MRNVHPSDRRRRPARGLAGPLIALGTAGALGTVGTAGALGSAGSAGAVGAAGALTARTRAGVVLPASWSRVTATNLQNTDEVSSVRLPSGVLLVAWAANAPAATRSLEVTAVSPTGKVGATVTVASRWSGIGNPSILRRPDGSLVIVAGAMRSIKAGETIQNQAMWSSADGGASWVVAPGDIATGSGGADAIGAALGPDGQTLFETWGTTFGLFVHRGVDPKHPSANLQNRPGWGCCGYWPRAALDQTTKRIVVGWYSNATHHPGVFAQAVDAATGAPLGAPALLPGSVTLSGGRPEALSAEQRTPVVARRGGGVYLAAVGGYPTATRALVWRYPTGGSQVVGQDASGLADAALAADPVGRLWALWATETNGRATIDARRSNPGASMWGAEVSVTTPPGTSGLWKLDGNAGRGALDVLASLSTPGSLATWLTRIEPGLTLTAKVLAAPRRVTFTVSDAGVPVPGATVVVDGHALHTGPAGGATLVLASTTPATVLHATADATGYVGASLGVSVPAPPPTSTAG